MTELYFTRPLDLPKVVQLSTTHDVAFTLHNIEHRQVIYRYTISAASGSDNTTKRLDSGSATLSHNQFKSVIKTVSIPSLSSPMAIQVDLEYQSASDDGKISDQKQLIKHWVKVAGFQS